MALWEWMRPRHRKDRAEVMRALAEPDDVRKVGYLIEALPIHDRSLRAAVEAALIRLLPQLTPEDAPNLNAEHRQILHQALSGGNVALALAILESLERIGDDRSVPFVRQLASSNDPAPEQYALREAAQRCLPLLLQRCPPDQLLRPSTPLQSAPELLLRSSTAPCIPADALRPPPDKH